MEHEKPVYIQECFELRVNWLRSDSALIVSVQQCQTGCLVRCSAVSFLPQAQRDHHGCEGL